MTCCQKDAKKFIGRETSNKGCQFWDNLPVFDVFSSPKTKVLGSEDLYEICTFEFRKKSNQTAPLYTQSLMA